MRSAPYFAIKHEPYRGDDIYILHIYTDFIETLLSSVHICTFVHTDPSWLASNLTFSRSMALLRLWHIKADHARECSLWIKDAFVNGPISTLAVATQILQDGNTSRKAHNSALILCCCIWILSSATPRPHTTACGFSLFKHSLSVSVTGVWLHIHVLCRCPLTQNHAMAEIYTGDFIFLSADDFASILQRYPKVS